MSEYGTHNRAYRVWLQERRKRKVRRFFYNLVDDLGIVLWSGAGLIVIYCVYFCVAHR